VTAWPVGVGWVALLAGAACPAAARAQGEVDPLPPVEYRSPVSFAEAPFALRESLVARARGRTRGRERWLCRGECNIRIDRLVIYPVLLLGVLAAGLSLLRAPRAPRSRT
jgi:hypothetical protein